MKDHRELAGQYVGLWCEPDAELRRRLIRELWADGGAHVLEAPQEIRQTAADLGFAPSPLEAHGHAAIEARVAHSYTRFVASGEFSFRPREDAVRLNNVVKFGWDTVSGATGEVVGGGLEVLVLDDEDRIVTDYMFPG
ncbi:hypothetical protein [Kribbella lupini]|uniref:SnoaL-like protein n=1 Tax=Kribbella lupini TaxID=291602 RepID=A0ABP4LQ05_9ACTN